MRLLKLIGALALRLTRSAEPVVLIPAAIYTHSINWGEKGETMRLRHTVAGLLAAVYVLLSHTTLAADATTIQLGQIPNWNPPTQLSLALLSSDQTTQTQVWATVTNGSLCDYPPDFNRHPSTFTIVTFSKNPRLLLDDIQTKRILETAIASNLAKCPPDQYSHGWAVAINREISTIDSVFVAQAAGFRPVWTDKEFDGVLAQRRQGPNENYYANNVSAQHHQAVAAAQENQRQQQSQRNADQALQAFASRYGAVGWIKWDVLMANPYSVEGSAYLFNTNFTRMITPTSGIFGNNFVVSDIPRNTFTAPIIPRGAPQNGLPVDPFFVPVTIILGDVPRIVEG